MKGYEGTLRGLLPLFLFYNLFYNIDRRNPPPGVGIPTINMAFYLFYKLQGYEGTLLAFYRYFGC